MIKALLVLVVLLVAVPAWGQDGLGGEPAPAGWESPGGTGRPPPPWANMGKTRDEGSSPVVPIAVISGLALLSLVVWLATRKPKVMAVAAPTTKKCPDCAELVKAEASVCRFCGFRWDGARVVESPSRPGR
jgi:hypothetical protein